MRVQITVTDDDGQTFEGEADLAPAGTRRAGARRARPTPAPAAAAPSPAADGKLDFGLPIRAFLKKHATGGGPRKFAVLLARITAGKTGVEVTREAVEKAWTQNKGVLGGDFQDMYATRSKGEGWTDAGKTRGSFILRSDWRGALK
jgi:hypothetical protein